jgi:hypothetical protein
LVIFGKACSSHVEQAKTKSQCTLELKVRETKCSRAREGSKPGTKVLSSGGVNLTELGIDVATFQEESNTIPQRFGRETLLIVELHIA